MIKNNPTKFVVWFGSAYNAREIVKMSAVGPYSRTNQGKYLKLKLIMFKYKKPKLSTINVDNT